MAVSSIFGESFFVSYSLCAFATIKKREHCGKGFFGRFYLRIMAYTFQNHRVWLRDNSLIRFDHVPSGNRVEGAINEP